MALRVQSDAALQKLLAEQVARIPGLAASANAYIAKEPLRVAAVRRTVEIDSELARVEQSLRLLWRSTVPRFGVVGKLLGMKVLPKNVKAEIDELWRKQKAIKGERTSLQIRETDWPMSNYHAALARLRSIEREIVTRVRKREAIDALRAAAAADASQTRKVGASIKRKLAKQGVCPYCGSALDLAAHADHIYPVAKGGRSTNANMVFACSRCNIKKRDLTLSAFIAKFGLDRSAIEARLMALGKDF